ncbi:MAG: glycosyltransferase, partial [Kiritimatiellia bacterium]|nr:glycosyltransferase [Kiritimatiellia bacterium]
MKLGINTLFLRPGEVGGSETYLVETIDALLQIDSERMIVLFTAREGHGLLFPRFGKNPRVCFQALEFSAENRIQRILREQFQLPAVARKWALDVLWSPGYTGPLFPPCPHVLSILDMQYQSHPDSLNIFHRWASDLLIQSGARRADRILAISEFSRREILRFTGAPADRVSVTPLAVSDDFRPAAPPPARDIP